MLSQQPPHPLPDRQQPHRPRDQERQADRGAVRSGDQPIADPGRRNAIDLAGRVGAVRQHRRAQPEARFEVIAPLGFGRCALKIAAPEATPYRGPESLAGARVATSYPRLTRRFLDERGIEASVVRMNGAVELAPRLGIAGFICDLVSTGATLEANGLVPVETVMESEAVLVRTLKPLSAAKQGLSDNLWRRIEGVLATQESKYIMLNAPEEALDAIAAILPGAESPTIIPLAGRAGHFAVHAVCQESVFWETLEKLKAAGASAILVMPIEKMMM